MVRRGGEITNVPRPRNERSVTSSPSCVDIDLKFLRGCGKSDHHVENYVIQ